MNVYKSSLVKVANTSLKLLKAFFSLILEKERNRREEGREREKHRFVVLIYAVVD